MTGFLRRNLKQANVIPFCGAGASAEGTTWLGGTPPLASELTNLLAEEANIALGTGDTLRGVYRSAEKRLGSERLRSFLTQHYQHVKPGNSQIILAKTGFQRIYTINIDDSLEQAHAHVGAPFDKLNFNSAIQRKPSPGTKTQIVKLNGDINNPDAGFIFSEEEYAKYAQHTDSWYAELARDYLYGYCLVFVGTKIDEPLFYHNVYRVSQSSQKTPGQSYIIVPSITEAQQDVFDDYNINFLPGKIDDFAKILKEEVPNRYSYISTLEANIPFIRKIIEDYSENGILDAWDEYNAVTYVSETLLNQNLKEYTGSPNRPFYYGWEPTWRDILDGVPAEISFIENFYQNFGRNHSFNVLTGSAGCGKTTTLMMAALKLAREDPKATVLHFRWQGLFPRTAMSQIIKSTTGKVYVFADDIDQYPDSLVHFIQSRTSSNVVIIGATREKFWRAIAYKFKSLNYEIHHVPNINERDVWPIINKIKKFGYYDILRQKPEDEQYEIVFKKSRRQLLIGLREATSGDGYENILENEYNSIQSEYLKFAFHLVALASMHRINLDISTFDSCVLQHYENVLLPRNQGLEGIVEEKAQSMGIRHPLVAAFVIEKCADKRQVLSTFKTLLTAVSRFGPKVSRNAPRRDFEVFKSIVNHSNTLSLFRQYPEDFLSIMYSFEKKLNEEPLFFLHLALFEFEKGRKYRDKGLQHIRMALNLWPDSEHIINSYAKISFSLAEEAPTFEKAAALMEEASEQLAKQVDDPRTEPYALVVRARGRLRVLRKWDRERANSELKQQQEELYSARKRYPSNPEIQKALQDLPLMLVRGKSQAKSQQAQSRIHRGKRPRRTRRRQ